MIGELFMRREHVRIGRALVTDGCNIKERGSWYMLIQEFLVGIVTL